MKSLLNEQLRRFNYTVGELDKIYHKAALKFGISDSVQAVLYTLRGEGRPCLISDICRFSGVSKQTLNSALRKMEQDGTIVLSAVNGKQKSAALTEKGERLADGTAAKIIEAENRIFEAWSEEERSEYLRLTRIFCEEMKKEIDNF